MIQNEKEGMKEMLGDERLLTLKEAYGYLKVSRSTVLRLIKREELKAHKVGNMLRFYERDLKRVIKPKNSDHA